MRSWASQTGKDQEELNLFTTASCTPVVWWEFLFNASVNVTGGNSREAWEKFRIRAIVLWAVLVADGWVDWMIFENFSNLIDSMILWFHSSGVYSFTFTQALRNKTAWPTSIALWPTEDTTISYWHEVWWQHSAVSRRVRPPVGYELGDLLLA